MFQKAIKIAQSYTFPVVVSFRREDGSTGSLIGAYIVLNEDGWILTAKHILDEVNNFQNEQASYNDYLQQIDENSKLSKTQRKTKDRSLTKPINPIINFSPWWGKDGWRVENLICDPLADLAIGKMVGFNKKCVSRYPEFKDPSVNFDVGESLCKLGFPFHNIDPTYDESKNAFQLPPEAIPITLFPIDGIFTRTHIVKEGHSCAEFVETSSPGLRGQSGGPTFDTRGRIWALQSRTNHYPLGFNPNPSKGRNPEQQYLHSGIGTHAKSIVNFLDERGIKFSISND